MAKKFQYTRVYVDPVDLKEIDQKMKRLFKISKQELSTEVGIWGTTTTRLAKERVPKDTNHLMKSISGRREGDQAVVEAKANYAPYVEFGTGRNVDLSELDELKIPRKYADEFKGKGKREVNLPARPYLYNSAREALRDMLSNMNRKIKNIVR
jgi:phage gpG-like protein